MARSALVWILTSLPATFAASSSINPWGYTQSERAPLGPKDWYRSYEACGQGEATEKQSPIDITGAVEDLELPPLSLTYPPLAQMTLTNDGHLMTLTLPHDQAVLSSPLLGEDDYVAHEWYIHWGRQECEGSEHLLNGHAFPMELHIMHWNKKYGTFADAQDHEDGLAVLAVFFKLGKANTALQQIIDEAMLEKLVYGMGSFFQLQAPLDLTEMVPEDAGTHYYTYSGSLTTPPCLEIVLWLVANSVMEVSQEQLDVIRNLRHDREASHVIGFNYRPVQPVNGRALRASFPLAEATQYTTPECGALGAHSGQIILALGAQLATTAVIGLVMTKVKQSLIIAFIVTGLVFGSINSQQLSLGLHFTHAMVEMGIMLVLFIAGMEVDISAMKSRWRLMLINGFGMIIINWLVSAILVYLLLEQDRFLTILTFSLCTTLSSTILVMSALQAHKMSETLHGQLTLGLMVFQDVTAVTFIAILGSLGTGQANGASGGLGWTIGLIFLKLFILILVVTLLSKYVLNTIFRQFATSHELLFIGSLGYAMGVGALCVYFQFSAEIGAFFAGVSLSTITYSLHIAKSMESLKTFGVVLFFIGLGSQLNFNAEDLVAVLPACAVFIVYVVFLSPIIQMFLGWISCLQSRTGFYMGCTINQISEFSLIVATLARAGGAFDARLFLAVTIICLGTFMLSGMGHVFLDQMWNKVGWLFKSCDRRVQQCHKGLTDKPDAAISGHVVCLSFNELSHEVILFYGSKNIPVYVMEQDPILLKNLQNHVEEAKRRIYANSIRASTLGDNKMEMMGKVGGKGGGAPNGSKSSGLKNLGVSVGSMLGSRPASPIPASSPTPLESPKEGKEEKEEADVSAEAGQVGVTIHTQGNGEGVTASPSVSLLKEAQQPSMRTRKESRNSLRQRQQNLLSQAMETMCDTMAYANVKCVYCDPLDPEAWHEFSLHTARLVVSCIDGAQAEEVALARAMSKDGVPFVAASSSHAEALSLYEAGCRFVIQTEHLSGMAFHQLLMENEGSDVTAKDLLMDAGKHHHLQINSINKMMGRVFDHF